MRFQAPESLSEQIAQHLGQRIVVGQLSPGDRIQELRIAGELDVSRGSVREALLILERRHLIEIFPRKGAVVSQLTPALVNSLYDIYIELLGMLARRLIETTEGADLVPLVNQMRALDTKIDASSEPKAEIIEAGFEVMRLAHRIVDNPFLEETLENFKPAISRTYYLAMDNFRGELAGTRRFFAKLAQAAVDRDADGLTRAIRDFGEHQRGLVLRTLQTEESAARHG
ncbi:GntR family transcriptional regulator [Marinobacter nanhaiticus D15-8W]|uniref:GntR family transcriptional regulator n=1 Tax=Marinobacter nanhaiticus D15-8W TaxID=626887 RepID=N6W171_9GAMM|nr:GntR family transcriptional regulator [Marinobacter nanhaiticus]ENO13859.1 GntR family transcriptional regulator [Marinobacter nanhaiticus D15-8W]BES71235.1 GntR family transcriptional regulator [Marinobacter nanhaiticus D15-8W]